MHGHIVQDNDERNQVEQARLGDSAAIGWLYDRYFDRIYRYVLFKVGNPEEAEDVAEAVFLRMIEALPGFQWQGSSFAPWLYRIAHNQVVDLLRQRTRRPQVALDPMASMLVAESGDPADWAETVDMVGHLRGALGRLTDLQAQVIALKFGGGLSNAEAGRILGRSEGAIKALQHSALENLCKWLRPHYGDDTPPREMGTVKRET
ncbi:MAG TPA: sigma-70 family RNA polymerase sigma factor [Chloroflexia bacterium]|nr:sigma-70 family RNA polymerase sigma factor [Chloroflexia bacterium]